ncbi:MAG: alpha/beta fold hydrolase [Candidatus Sumerlaeota bacterium]|nr:alpha/beta fold hydrolase [Candidatus Sumerlaeota bacterium]
MTSPQTQVRVPTLGGSVWWTTVWEQDGYRIQTHKITGWRRLIDPANVLITTGDFDECLEALAKELNTPPANAPVNFNIPFPTLGGKQFWGDEFYANEWKIQRNSVTGHYRLLDPNRVRRAWGTYDQCLREYKAGARGQGAGVRGQGSGISEPKTENRKPETASSEPKTENNHRTLVILLHGIFRSPDSFSKLSERLKSEGYDVCAVAYPSTQVSIPDHAAQLNRLLERLEGYDAIYFVCHSMGGLVARYALSQRPEKRARGIVTLGTPHNGAMQADMLKDWLPYKFITGQAGQQLISGAGSLAAALPEPPCPMACIAGGKGNKSGFSPIIPGDDDGTVELASALNNGKTSDTLVVNSLHSFLMNNSNVIEAVVRFIKTGSVK